MPITGVKQDYRFAQRREFLKFGCLAAAVAAVGARATTVRAEGALPPLSESDPQARSLGYQANAAHVDRAKFPKYQPGQSCSDCQLYHGKPGAASGPCSIFPGKAVNAKGWCNAHVLRA